MSFGTKISETDHDYIGAAGSYVWVNGSAHLISMAQLSIGPDGPFLRDYTVTLDLAKPTSPKLTTSRIDVTGKSAIGIWDPGTPTE
jgi:hypothetical protein